MSWSPEALLAPAAIPTPAPPRRRARRTPATTRPAAHPAPTFPPTYPFSMPLDENQVRAYVGHDGRILGHHFPQQRLGRTDAGTPDFDLHHRCVAHNVGHDAEAAHPFQKFASLLRSLTGAKHRVAVKNVGLVLLGDRVEIGGPLCASQRLQRLHDRARLPLRLERGSCAAPHSRRTCGGSRGPARAGDLRVLRAAGRDAPRPIPPRRWLLRGALSRRTYCSTGRSATRCRPTRDGEADREPSHRAPHGG